VLGREYDIEIALGNVISNAIKYGAGQPIVVTGSCAAAQGAGGKGTVRITVRDRGHGVPAQSLATMYEKGPPGKKPDVAMLPNAQWPSITGAVMTEWEAGYGEEPGQCSVLLEWPQ
jgi:hypothetical protein